MTKLNKWYKVTLTITEMEGDEPATPGPFPKGKAQGELFSSAIPSITYEGSMFSSSYKLSRSISLEGLPDQIIFEEESKSKKGFYSFKIDKVSDKVAERPLVYHQFSHPVSGQWLDFNFRFLPIKKAQNPHPRHSDAWYAWLARYEMRFEGDGNKS